MNMEEKLYKKGLEKYPIGCVIGQKSLLPCLFRNWIYRNVSITDL